MRHAILLLLVVLPGVAGEPEEPLKRWKSPARGSFVHKQSELGGVLKSIADHFGEEVKLDAPADRPVDLQAKGVTFFEALDRLAEKGKLTLVIGDRGDLTLMDAGVTEKLQVAYLGPSRLSVEQAIRAKAWDESDILKIELAWLVPKGLECVAVRAELDRVADDEGTICTLVEKSRNNGFPLGPNRKVEFCLTSPSPKATRLPRLAGTLHVAFEAKRESVTFAVAEGATMKRLGRCAVMFHGIDDPPALHVTLTGWPCADFVGGEYDRPGLGIVTKGGSAYAPWPPGLTGIGASCYGEGGKEIGMSGATRYSQKQGEPRWEHTIGLEAVPSKIVLDAVTEVTIVRVRFLFENVTIL